MNLLDWIEETCKRGIEKLSVCGKTGNIRVEKIDKDLPNEPIDKPINGKNWQWNGKFYEQQWD